MSQRGGRPDLAGNCLERVSELAIAWFCGRLSRLAGAEELG